MKIHLIMRGGCTLYIKGIDTLLINVYKITKKELYYTYFTVFFCVHFRIFHS